jgi:phage repressor protein C with HTH and peptisase S24 domain
MNSRERILQFVDYKNISKNKFYKETGLSNGFLDKNNHPGADKLEQIIYAYPEINPEWLLTGKGEMLRGDINSVIVNTSIFSVKLVGQYAYAGYLNSFSDQEYMENLPEVPFLISEGQTHRGEYLAFEVRGDSMDDDSKDSIIEGDLALGRFIQPHLYIDSKLHYRKWNFIIVHKTDGILIKQITDHNLENKTITIHSLNSRYSDKIIPLSDVAQIFNVVQILRKTK